MRILVTGAAGFIGSNFVHYLLDGSGEYEVVSLDALTYAGDKSNLRGVLQNPNHRFVEGDIRDEELVESLVGDSDVVVNFAAESHVDRSIESSEPFVSTNIEGVRTLLDAAKDAELDVFVQVSTDEVYGEIPEGKFREGDPLDPRNPYAATKASADLLAKSYKTTYGVPAVITRSCNNFGPRQHEEKLIPKFILRSSQGESLPVYGDGSNVREWIYVKDNCRAIETVVHEASAGEVYNIGSGEEMRNIDVTRKIIQKTDASMDQIEFVEDRKGHDYRYSLNSTKIEELGWSPEWSFDQGLTKTVNHYLNKN